jgi:hypothetical protein
MLSLPPIALNFGMDAGACDRWAGRAGVAPSHRVPLHTEHSTRSGRLWGARQSGEWTFPSALVAGLGLQAFALGRACAAGSLVARALGRMSSLTGQSVSPLLRAVVLAPARGFFQSCAPRGPQPLCSGRFLAPLVGGAGGVRKRVFLRPAMQARGLCLRRCVLGWSVATVCRWALGLCRAPGRISAISRVAGVTA